MRSRMPAVLSHFHYLNCIPFIKRNSTFAKEKRDCTNFESPYDVHLLQCVRASTDILAQDVCILEDCMAGVFWEYD